MASKRKSKTKKGRSPSMAARIAGVTDQVKTITTHIGELEDNLTTLKRRVADLENAKTEPDEDPESTKPEATEPMKI